MSPLFPTNQLYTCSKCHLDSELIDKYFQGSSQKVQYYMESVHARGLVKVGLVVSATCSSCHGAHDIRVTTDPKSHAFRMNIPKTCGECHLGIYNDYIEGVHGKDFLAGNRDVPVCTDCHSEHSILSPDIRESTVSSVNIPGMCTGCHDDVALDEKYQIPARRLGTFQDTFHGVALRFGNTRVANCASCHDYHDIRPSSDPRSPIHPDNLHLTCGKCHPNAGVNFAKGKVHINEVRESSLLAYFVQLFYTIFIITLIGGFSLMILIDLYGRWRRSRGSGQ
jgi:hypothetical protein